jgi:flagellar biogenesis protein FliO
MLEETAPAVATLNLFGATITTLTWVLLIAINLWCLRRLFRSQAKKSLR